MVSKWYSGTLGGLKLPDFCLTSEEKPRKNLTQESCPDRGSNPGPAWQACMLPLVPQRCTICVCVCVYIYIKIKQWNLFIHIIPDYYPWIVYNWGLWYFIPHEGSKWLSAQTHIIKHHVMTQATLENKSRFLNIIYCKDIIIIKILLYYKLMY